MIAIIGAGVGGLTAAIALRSIGEDVTIYEQAGEFRRIGSTINLTPNAVNVLDGLGLGEAIRKTACAPAFSISKTYDSGNITSRVAFGETALARYGATPLLMHRADLMEALVSAVPGGQIRFGKKLAAIAQSGGGVHLTFADGSTATTEVCIAADGIHSTVRAALFEPEPPRFTGMVAYRGLTPNKGVILPDLDSFVKWWGPDPQSQIIHFPVSTGREIFVFATVPGTSEVPESWSAEGDIALLRQSFPDYHDDARALIRRLGSVLRTALHERAPLQNWVRGNVALLGDACHAMTPFMAQGAAMGLEDAVILTRAVKQSSDWPGALACYERTRVERANAIQLASHNNEWLRKGGNPDWVYGYDAWSTDLL